MHESIGDKAEALEKQNTESIRLKTQFKDTEIALISVVIKQETECLNERVIFIHPAGLRRTPLKTGHDVS